MAGVVFVIGIIAVVAWFASSVLGIGEDYEVTGRLYLQSEAMVVGDTCAGMGGYSDIGEGTRVVISNQDGKILATSRLETYLASEAGCSFEWTADVDRADFYDVTISHRGGLTMSFDEMEQSSWRVSATLGDFS